MYEGNGVSRGISQTIVAKWVLSCWINRLQDEHHYGKPIKATVEIDVKKLKESSFLTNER